jgi:hypothetical protein
MCGRPCHRVDDRPVWCLCEKPSRTAGQPSGRTNTALLLAGPRPALGRWRSEIPVRLS